MSKPDTLLIDILFDLSKEEAAKTLDRWFKMERKGGFHEGAKAQREADINSILHANNVNMAHKYLAEAKLITEKEQ